METFFLERRSAGGKGRERERERERMKILKNREDILNARDKLTEVLEEANTLFNGFLILASDLGKEKAKQLSKELIRDEDSSDFEFIVYDSWKISGKTAENTFNKTHTFHFLILGFLQTYFQEDPNTPMLFFDFDGFARIKLDQDRLPIIEPVNINEENEGIDQNTQIRNQGIIALSYRDWEEIVKTFEISEPVIASGQSQQRLST
ncbi:unnamed protein product [Nyctereutes procyonoides]|uniref:Non-structural maintenance of chromosomes element 4 n=1 Tax=Nyctereutes procyonoides TaxID=34880 RepID=A0A811Y624_NYCPR|nr:unnamed protein product [Nyctereutes procyonoides]